MVVSSTSQLFVKPLQWVRETTEGTLPDDAPTVFADCGAVDALSYKKDNSLTEVGIIGPEDVVGFTTGITNRTSNIKFGLVNSTLLKRAVNSANYGTPADTISESISLVYSTYINGTENYIVLKGTRPKSASINMEVGKTTECTMDFVHTEIDAPITTSDAGLTSPTWVTSFASGDVWDWLDGGTAPITVDGNDQNAIKFSCNIERNTTMDYTLGNTAGFGSQPHGRRITGEFTTLWTGTTEEALLDAGTDHTILCNLKDTVSLLTLSNCKISVVSRDHSADETGATVTTYSYVATSASLT